VQRANHSLYTCVFLAYIAQIYLLKIGTRQQSNIGSGWPVQWSADSSYVQIRVLHWRGAKRTTSRFGHGSFPLEFTRL